MLGLLMQACSFVELSPGANQIIFANHQTSCQKIGEFQATVRTHTLLIGRTSIAIAEELQILAQNEAYEKRGNAIWPSSEVENGQQRFDILQCDNY